MNTIDKSWWGYHALVFLFYRALCYSGRMLSPDLSSWDMFVSGIWL